MIIERKFELIGTLVNADSASKNIFYEEMRKEGKTDKEIDEILALNADTFFYLADMDNCIPQLDEIAKRHEELDQTTPYDNGMTYRDITAVRSLPSRKGTATVLAMISRMYGEQMRIAQVIAVEYADGKTTVIDHWDIGRVDLR